MRPSHAFEIRRHLRDRHAEDESRHEAVCDRPERGVEQAADGGNARRATRRRRRDRPRAARRPPDDRGLPRRPPPRRRAGSGRPTTAGATRRTETAPAGSDRRAGSRARATRRASSRTARKPPSTTHAGIRSNGASLGRGCGRRSPPATPLSASLPPERAVKHTW